MTVVSQEQLNSRMIALVPRIYISDADTATVESVMEFIRDGLALSAAVGGCSPDNFMWNPIRSQFNRFLVSSIEVYIFISESF